MLKNQKKKPVRKAPVKKAPVKKAPVRKAPVRKAPVKGKKKGGNHDKKQNEKPKTKLKRTDALNPYLIQKYSMNYHDMMHLPLIPGLHEVGPQKRATVTEFNTKNNKMILSGGQKNRRMKLLK